MNDVQFVEAAKVLAEQSMQNEPTFDAQLDFMSTRVLARPLTLAEHALAKKAFDNFRAHYQAHGADAEKLLAVGERKHDPSLAQADFAAMTMLANQLLNLDEVLNK